MLKMKRVLILIALSFVVALLNIAVSFLGPVNLVWAAAVALYISEREKSGIVFAVASGVMFDIMMHGNVGLTTISILGALLIYVLVKSIGFGDRSWQKLGISFVVMFLALMLQSLGRALLEGNTSGFFDLQYFLQGAVVNTVILVAFYIMIYLVGDRFTSKNVVKL